MENGKGNEMRKKSRKRVKIPLSDTHSQQVFKRRESIPVAVILFGDQSVVSVPNVSFIASAFERIVPNRLDTRSFDMRSSINPFFRTSLTTSSLK